MWTSSMMLTLAALGLLIGAAPASAEMVDFAPEGEGFAVEFPANPSFQPDTPSKDIVFHAWTANEGDTTFFVGRGVTKDNQPITDADKTLSGDEDDFVASVQATVIQSNRIDWPGPDGTLPAILFSFGVGGGYGEYLEAIRAQYVFGFLVLSRTDAPDVRAEVDREIKTLKITK